MRNTAKRAAKALSMGAILGSLALIPLQSSAAEGSADLVAKGKEVAFDRRKGNCLACHMMDDGESPGDIGPPLVAMKARYPDKAALRAQLDDPEKANPNTRMPPFGKHRILSDSDIDANDHDLDPHAAPARLCRQPSAQRYSGRDHGSRDRP